MSTLNLIPKNKYRFLLSKDLPKGSFEEDTGELIRYFVLILIYLLGIIALTNIQSLLIKIPLSISMGIVLTSLTFFLHDLMHGSYLKSKRITYLVGLSIGILNFFPPFFWQRLHNFHHSRTGNIDDPDRMYLLDEKPKNLFEIFQYKMRISSEAYNPILSLIFISTGFFWYFGSTLFYGLIARSLGIKIPKKYQRIQELFKWKDKLFVIGELVLILSFQLFLFNLVAQGNFLDYFFISLLPVLIAHFILMLHIHTNHFLSPFTGDIDDPLVNAISLKYNKVFDKLFLNFSHHVEHHLFPAMSPRHYPKVRKLLLNHYPNRFQLIPIVDSVRLLFNTPRIYADNTHLVTLDGKKVFNCLLPKE